MCLENAFFTLYGHQYLVVGQDIATIHQLCTAVSKPLAHQFDNKLSLAHRCFYYAVLWSLVMLLKAEW